MVDAFRTLAPYSNRLTHNIAEETLERGQHGGEASGLGGDRRRRRGRGPRCRARSRGVGGQGREVRLPIPEILERFERTAAAEALTYWEGFAAFIF